MDEKVLLTALAGLLHDIGKVEQRAMTGSGTFPPGFENSGLPPHAAHTAYFAQTYLPETYRSTALAGAYHHSPEQFQGDDNRLCKLVSLADKLSAGERVDPKGNDHLPRHMISIFDRVALTKAHREKDWHYLPLSPLSLNKRSLFPGGRQEKDSKGDGYQALFERLTTIAGQDMDDLQSYVENMLGAMQISTWCVPSAYYYSAPDVSLYDHSHMTAALAVCLNGLPDTDVDSLYGSVSGAFQTNTKLPDTPVALLIGGDISGIQNFIYTITSKKAAQTLRGRSFYLQLLTEAVLRYVLHELGLPYSNVIYSGGGHFFLLAPLDASQELPKIRRAITEKLLEHHGTSLYIALGSAEVPASGFESGRFPDYWGKMHEDLGLFKQHRYTELEDEIYQTVFAIKQTGGNPDDTCSVCGNDALKTDPFEDYDETQSRICSLCESFFEQIGKRLPQSNFVALGWQDPMDTEPGTLADVLKSFGMQFQLLADEKEEIKLDGLERITIWALEDPSNGFPDTGRIPSACLLRYTVNKIPVWQSGEPVTFDELQDEVDNGFKRLGVLRMDVDNLGDIFKRGLGKFATLARVSTLSFQMSLFFEGWVKRICEEPPFKGRIYAVYAGGDDVFLIGPWNLMPELAVKIRSDFSEYTGHNPDLHSSAGMAFISGKYPVYQAAEDADQVLHSAKSSGRNAFGFLGSVWNWTEFEEVQKKFVHLVKIVDSTQLNGPQAILQVLQDLSELKVKKIKETKNKDVWGAWQWRGAYLLARMAEREKKRPELVTEIKTIREDLDPAYTNIHQWGSAARWAQLKMRKKPKRDDESI